MRQLLLFAAIAALASQAGTQAPAETGDVEMMPAHIIRSINQSPTVTVTRNLPPGSMQGVLSQVRAWEANQPIRVCFFGGNETLRRRIAAKAMEWDTKVAGIALDFGDLQSPRLCDGSFAQIRVGYSDKGYWSYVGKDSVTIPTQYQQSMNFSRFDTNPPPDEEFNRVVLHEFGHALGFQHEHQHPSGVCNDQFNWPFIYSYLGGSPNFWDRETVDWNMKSRAYQDGDIVTNFNPKSIMLYTFKPQFYNNGTTSTCYHSYNSELSDGDIEIAKMAYSGNQPALRTAEIGALRAAALTLPVTQRAEVERDIAIYQSDFEGQKRILGEVDSSRTDVDVFACKNQTSSIELRDRLATYLSNTGGFGRLRVRGDAYLPTGAAGVTVIRDANHPEAVDGARIARSLEAATGDNVSVVPNTTATTPWLVSVVAC